MVCHNDCDGVISIISHDLLPILMNITDTETHMQHYDIIVGLNSGLVIVPCDMYPPSNRRMHTPVAYVSLLWPLYIYIIPVQGILPGIPSTTQQ